MELKFNHDGKYMKLSSNDCLTLLNLLGPFTHGRG